MAAFLIVFFVLMLIGMPIAFCMIGSSALYIIMNGLSARVIVEKLITGPNSFTLLAIPFFILAANLMNNGGVTERIFTFCRKFVGHIPGGLGHVNIVCSIIFAGMSGAAVADAGGLGQIELKAMRDAGFDDDFSLAVTGASSTIGPIIPPSIPAVVFAVAGSVSIGKLFIGGLIPGLVMALGMGVVVYIWAKQKNYPRDPKSTLKEKIVAFARAFLSLLTPLIIIVGIWTGYFTPTEAAIVATVYALFLSLIVYQTLNLRDLKKIFLDTATSTLVILIIIASSSIFGWVLTYERVPQLASQAVLSLVTNKYIVMLLIIAILLVVGCFMETIAAITITTPILLPIAESVGFSPVQAGIIMILTLMIGLITPPVGLVTYTLANISGQPFYRIAKATIPFLISLIVVVLLLVLIPQLTTLLPGIMYR